MNSLAQKTPGWQQIAKKSLRSVVAALLPVYYTMSGGSAQALEPFQVSLEELFDEGAASVIEPLVSNDSDESLMRFRGGVTSANKSFESHVGGTYGLDGVIPVDDVFGLHWAGRINQFSGATQYLTSFGAYKRSDANGDALGASLIVDVFHDSRVSDLWLSQLRGQVGVATSEDSAIGVAFTTPLGDARENQLFVPGNPVGSYTAAESVGMYATRYIDDYLMQANVGYRKYPNSVYVDLAVRRPIVNNKVFAYASTNYIAENGQWSSWVGLEFRLGGGDDCDSCTPTRRREVWDDPTIFNSFNYGENSFWHNTNNPDGSGNLG